jgi:hypothetical protein
VLCSRACRRVAAPVTPRTVRDASQLWRSSRKESADVKECLRGLENHVQSAYSEMQQVRVQRAPRPCAVARSHAHLRSLLTACGFARRARRRRGS